MGNLVSSGAAGGAAGGGVGKVVMADGSVRVLSEPVSVAELMMDHPRHFVVDARVLQQQQQQQKHKGGGGGASSSSKKVAPLPADHVLGAGGVYVLLPATRGKVSADEARRVLTAASRSLSLSRSRSMPGAGLMRRRRTKLPSSTARKTDETDADAAAAQVQRTAEEEETAAAADGFEEHRPEFLSRELSMRGWKPSLNTIEERVVPRKVSHWLF